MDCYKLFFIYKGLIKQLIYSPDKMISLQRQNAKNYHFILTLFKKSNIATVKIINKKCADYIFNFGLIRSKQNKKAQKLTQKHYSKEERNQIYKNNNFFTVELM